MSPVADTDVFGSRDGEWSDEVFDQTLVELGNEVTKDDAPKEEARKVNEEEEQRQLQFVP